MHCRGWCEQNRYKGADSHHLRRQSWTSERHSAGLNVVGSVNNEHEGRRSFMAGSVNKVILIGNLGADPEIRHTQDGRPIANLRVATSESWRDKASGERRERTEWHRVVIFNEGLCR